MFGSQLVGCGQASRELYFLGSSDTGKAVETLAKLKATFAKIEELEKMGG